MAVDQTNKALNLAQKTVDSTNAMMNAIEQLLTLDEERSASGLNLSDYDDDFANSSLKHVNGAKLDAVLNTSMPAVWQYIKDNFHDTNFQTLRP